MVFVKIFLENIPIFRNAIFRKGKCFHVFGCSSKYFSKNIFWCLEKKLEKKKEEAKPRKTLNKPRRTRRDLAIDSAISRSVDRSSSRSFSLSFSLCASSLCASPVPEIIWSENRNGNEFLWSTLLFYGQLKMISRKFNFPNQPNSLFYEKWFLETIFTKNKHSLIKKLLKIKKNWDSVW